MELDVRKVKDQIIQLTAAMARIDARAAAENRPLNETEATWIAECQDAIKESRLSLPEGPVTLDYGHLGGSSRPALGNALPFALRGPNDRKDYHSLFGNRQDYTWKDESIDFFHAVVAGRHHPDLRNSAMTEGVPSDGGFLVPVEQSARIHAVSLENELVMPRCFVQPMISNTIHLPAMSIGSHATNLFGGFTASYTAEEGTITEHNPKTRSMELNAKKLTGLLRFSNELVQDIPGGEGQITAICGKGLAWYRDKAFLKGTGAGEPLGILNASCVVAVAKETGQKADTIIYENLTKMLARMYAGGFANSVWVCHQSTIPQLLTLSLSVGTGGAAVPVLNQANGQFTILTRPVIFTEKTATLGDRGDIMLADFSQYVVGLRGEMRFDTSIHVGFTTDELYARLIERHDGQPLWDEPLTLEGGTTVSPFVVLAERV
jgi:HK97 family phage major capsid protein